MARSLRVSVLAAALLWGPSVLADPNPADRATARALAGEGYQALQDKDYATAADRFSRADALVHAPTLMIDWARALVGMGKFVEAQERYEQILREGVDPKAPKSWSRAYNDAQQELAVLKPRLAWVTISVSGSSNARVTIDGAEVPRAALGVRRAVNPGSRQIRVQAKGFLVQRKVIDLTEGAERAAQFKLEPDPDAQEPQPVTPQRATVAGPPLAEHDPTPMYVAFGVSGAGFAVGVVTGVVALSKRATLSRNCDANSGCPPDQASTLNSYRTLGTVSGVGYAVGIAGAGTGVTLWLLNRTSKPESTQGFTVRPFLGLASIGAAGRF